MRIIFWIYNLQDWVFEWILKTKVEKNFLFYDYVHVLSIITLHILSQTPCSLSCVCYFLSFTSHFMIGFNEFPRMAFSFSPSRVSEVKKNRLLEKKFLRCCAHKCVSVCSWVCGCESKCERKKARHHRNQVTNNKWH